MLLRNWLLFLNENQQQTRNRRVKGRRPHVPAEIETLEDRTLLTQFLVDSLFDHDTFAFDEFSARNDGFGLSLREAIRLANQNGGGFGQGQLDGDSILFDAAIAGGTIQLDPFFGALFISDDLLINGADPDPFDGFDGNIGVSGGGQTQVFVVDAGFAPGFSNLVSFENLIIRDGRAFFGNGGGIESRNIFDSLSLNNVDVLNNSADFAGGGMALSGSATVTVSRFHGNMADEGGGIANFGTLELFDSLIGSTGSEADVFTRGVNAGELVFAYADARGESFFSNTTMELLDSNGFFLESDFGDGSRGPVIAGYQTGFFGSAFVNLRNFGNFDISDTPYELYTAVVDSFPDIFEFESNNIPPFAQFIGSDQLVAGNTQPGDVDFYNLGFVGAGDRIVAMLDSDPDGDFFGTPLEMAIVDSTGATVFDLDTSFQFETGSAVSIATPFSGQYFLRITGLEFGDTDYQFVTQVVSPFDLTPEFEPNDNINQANFLFSGSSVGVLEALGNRANLRGGGIYNTGLLTLNNFTQVASNQAGAEFFPPGDGGGIYNLGDINTGNGFGARIESNTATGNGGGIANAAGFLDLSGATINFNVAEGSGGGIEHRDGTLTLTNVSLENNNAGGFGFGASEGNGGGLAITGFGTAELFDSMIRFNFTSNDGGGIWNLGGNLTLDGSTVESNTNGFEGGRGWRDL